ncbi:MAG: DUF4123 domain-containing protein [Pseudomonadota bacterium]
MRDVSPILSIPMPFDESGAHIGTHRFAILDGAFDEDLAMQIYLKANDGLPTWHPLVIDTPYADLYKASPCLVLCEDHPALIDYASAMLGQLDAGCVLWLEEGVHPDQAAAHCRSLLSARDERNQQRMFRFYEPRWLEPLFSVISQDEAHDFLGPFSAIAWRNERGWRQVSRVGTWSGEINEHGWFWLDGERQAQLGQARLPLIAARLASDYQPYHPAATEERVLEALLQASKWGYDDLASQERWLRLELQAPAGSLSSDRAQQILTRPDLAKGEKLDALERTIA